MTKKKMKKELQRGKRLVGGVGKKSPTNMTTIQPTPKPSHTL